MNTKENILSKEMNEEVFINSFMFKTIYLVKYKLVHYMPNSKVTRNTTYNLFTFEDLNMARDYMNLAHELIVKPNVTSGKFYIMFETNVEELPPDEDGKVIWKKSTKLAGNDARHESQTKFFTFTIETINFRPKNPDGKCIIKD